MSTLNEYRYDAFISYRHVEPDRTMAKWLHAQLESYRVPKKLVQNKNLPSRLKRVFRDEEELEASPNLSDAIDEALTQSRFLIVVCSPRTPASQWVNAEVRRFRELNRDDRILALLIEGEPANSFPPALCEIRRTSVDSAGNTTETLEEIDPLAADIRSQPNESRGHALRMAKLRILAPLLCCRFDDLRRREQERQTRIFLAGGTLLVSLLLLMTCLAVLAYSSKLDADTANLKLGKANSDLRLANQRSEQRRVAAEERRKLIQTHLYSAELNHFTKAWEAGQFGQVYRILDATRPENTYDELRGWEWFYLHDLANSHRVRFDRHPAEISAFAISPDDQRVASGDVVGNVILWNADTGEVEQRCRPFSSSVLELAFSPSGKHLAIAGANGSAVVVGIATGETTHTFDEHVLAVQAIAYGPNDEVLATASADGTIKVSNAKSGKWTTDTLHGHAGVIRDLCFDKTGTRLSSVSDDRTLRFWKLNDGKWQTELTVEGVPSNTAVNPDLKRFAIWLPEQSAVAIVDARANRVVATLQDYDEAVRDMWFDRDGGLLATVDQVGISKVWKVSEEGVQNSGLHPARLVGTYHGAAKTVRGSPSGKWIGSICVDGTVKIWPARDRRLNDFRGHAGFATSVTFSADGKLIASGDAIGEVRIWDAASGRLLHSLGRRLRVVGPRGTPESAARRAGVLDIDRKNLSVMRLDSAEETWVWVFVGHAGMVNEVAFSPDGRVLASAGTGGRILLWDVASGEEIAVLRHPSVVSGISYSPDGQWLVTGCWDDQVRIWNVAKRELHATLQGHLDNVNAVTVNPSGNLIASGGSDGHVYLWELPTGTLVDRIPGHQGSIETLAFSPKGETLASGAEDQTIKVWNVATRELMCTLSGHTQRVSKLLFHPTQDRLFSSSAHSDDARLRVWDLTISREIVALAAPTSDIEDVAIDPSGRTIALTAGRGITVWDASEKGRLKPQESVPVNFDDLVNSKESGNSPVKVLGYMRRTQLMRAIENMDDPIRPSAEDRELWVIVLSVPNLWLYPTDEQYRLLQLSYKARRKAPPGPPRSFLMYESKRFKCYRADGEATTAFAIAPFPFAFDGGGFKEGNMRETGTSIHRPDERAMIGVVFDLPRDLTGDLELQFDETDLVPIPRVELQDYRWRRPRRNIYPDKSLADSLISSVDE